MAKEQGLKSAWLASLQMWGIRVWDVWTYIALHTNEPITESEHRRLVDEAEAELPEPDEERVEFLRQRWLRQDT